MTTAADTAPAAAAATTAANDARLDAVVTRLDRLFGPTADPAGTAPDRGSFFAFQDAMNAVEREVYGR
jgi:hypothetical protein